MGGGYFFLVWNFLFYSLQVFLDFGLMMNGLDTVFSQSWISELSQIFFFIIKFSLIIQSQNVISKYIFFKYPNRKFSISVLRLKVFSQCLITESSLQVQWSSADSFQKVFAQYSNSESYQKVFSPSSFKAPLEEIYLCLYKEPKSIVALYSTVQYSAVHYSAVQYKIVQYSTVISIFYFILKNMQSNNTYHTAVGQRVRAK